MLQKAKAVAAMPISLRFMMFPMNRATCFSGAPNQFSAYAKGGLGIDRNCVETGNAVRATRKYIR